MFKVDLEKAEEPEIKLPTSFGSQKKQENSRKASTSASSTMLSLCVDHKKLWKILQEIGIRDHLTCLLRNLYASKEATVRSRYGTTDWLQIGKGVHQGCLLSPCLFNLYAELLLLLSHFSCVQLCATPQMAAHQAPPSLGFSRQEHWSELPFPSPMHESEM